jgi:hypothetical protein
MMIEMGGGACMGAAIDCSLFLSSMTADFDDILNESSVSTKKNFVHCGRNVYFLGKTLSPGVSYFTVC